MSTQPPAGCPATVPRDAAGTPRDPYAYKTMLAALTVVAIVVKGIIQDHSFDWTEEGLTTLIGAVGTIAVYLKSNWKHA